MLRRFSIVALLLLTVSSTGCLFRSRRIPQVTSASAKTATLDELLQFLNRQAAAIDQMRYYRNNSIVKSGTDPKQAGIQFNGHIIVGKFID